MQHAPEAVSCVYHGRCTRSGWEERPQEFSLHHTCLPSQQKRSTGCSSHHVTAPPLNTGCGSPFCASGRPWNRTHTPPKPPRGTYYTIVTKPIGSTLHAAYTHYARFIQTVFAGFIHPSGPMYAFLHVLHMRFSGPGGRPLLLAQLAQWAGYW